ncbi:hypothetical protein K0G47_24395 [Bacteroides thetaiotaomicron]|uniref:hypothetical protein n=1 Tax=Bacteroides thetaiotaomicron TaxID=818 RepID=UPI001F1F569B|nr:hypothetical protein [Bacteroides thetaiotaomicron]MCE9021680.1 hypothetical protein [Bacteroides thetaiotaomicron]
MNRIGGRDVGVSARPYIDPDLLKHVKMAISTWGKSNDDPDRTVLKDLSGNGNDMRLLNFGFAGNSGYGLYSTDFTKWTKRQINDLEVSPNKISVSNKDSETALVIWLDVNKNRYVIPSYKIKVSKLTKTITYYYIDEANPSIRSTFSINKEGTYILPISRNDLYNGEENTNIGFGIFPHESFTIEQLPDFEGWLCTDGVDDIIESVKPVSEMLEGSNEITVVSIIHQISLRGISDIPLTNYIRESNIGYVRNELRVSLNKTGIYGYTCFNIQSPISSNSSVINNILGDKEDYRLGTYGKISNAKLSVQGFIDSSGAIIDTSQVAYAGGFIANKVLTTDEINQIIAYFNLDRPGQIIKPQLYCNIKKQGITNYNHAEFNDQLIDFVGGHNIQLNNIGWEGESGINDGALYLDGISDFGKATGLPVLKDYTICALRKWLYGDSVTSTETGSIVSKSKVGNDGAFILEQTFNRNPSRSSTFSFGTINSLMSNDKLNEESFTYQTKYSYNGETIVSGSGVDIDSMWLGTIRDGDSRFSKLALWSLMLFPYSLSEFLLERQLRKYKAGTLYPDMIEFRPIVKSNIPYLRILYFITSTGDQIIKGSYIPIGSVIQINIQTVNATDEISSVSVNGKEVDMYNKDETYWRYRFKVTKSPQKINIVISSYLTMLGNDTLISNETLIKNE